MKKCSVEGCNSKHYAKGLCYKDYARNLRKNGTSSKAVCSIEGCTTPAITKGLCSRDYQRSRKVEVKPQENVRTDYAEMVEDCMELLNFGVTDIEELWRRSGFVSEQAMRYHLTEEQREKVSLYVGLSD